MSLSRRTFLTGFSGLTLYLIASSARARVTPWQSLGPFYPQKLPVDSDADLTFVDGKNGQANGSIHATVGSCDGSEWRADQERPSRNMAM